MFYKYSMANVLLNVVDKDTAVNLNNNDYTASVWISKRSQFVSATDADVLRFIKLDGTLTRNLLVPEIAYVATATVAADTTLTDAHCYVRINAGSGNINLTLPAASGVTGKLLKFFRTDGSSNKVTLTGTVNGEVNPASDGGGVASPLYMQYGQMTIISNGTSWDAC